MKDNREVRSQVGSSSRVDSIRESEVRKRTFFVLYIITIGIMAIIYFSVPEREAFLENQVQWWSELWEVVTEEK